MQTIYFDYAATTPVHPEVLKAMLPYMSDDYGNASSIHHMGRKPSVVLESCRGRIARSIGAGPSEIIFTSGGTESNNAAIFGALSQTTRRTIVSARTEHNAVLFPVEYARKLGYEVKWLALDADGRVLPQALSEVLDSDTALVSLMHVNNETGVVQPIGELAELCREAGVPFHCDTVQSVGKVRVDVQALGVDFLSMSAHKIYGPKGCGALYVRTGAPWDTWMHGGAQERGRRGGTVNIAGIAGLDKALAMAMDEMPGRTEQVQRTKAAFLQALHDKLAGQFIVNGGLEHTIDHILSVTLTGADGEPLDGEMLLLNLDMEGICTSNGAACTSGSVKPSHVMLALGHNDAMAKSTLRFSFGNSNTPDQAYRAVEVLAGIVARHTSAGAL